MTQSRNVEKKLFFLDVTSLLQLLQQLLVNQRPRILKRHLHSTEPARIIKLSIFNFLFLIIMHQNLQSSWRNNSAELLSDITQLENWRRKQIQSGHFKHFLKNIISDGFLFYSANTGGTPTTCDHPWLLLASSILKHKDGNFRTDRKFNATRIYRFATENPQIRGKKP